MANQSETGHAKNVANFSTLITIVKGFKTVYNPSKSSIALPALTTLKTAADAVIAEVNTALGAYNTAIAARELAFGPLSKLATRILNSIKATDAPKPVVNSAAALVRKLQGRRATPKKTEEELAASETEGAESKQISSSQMSFDNRIDNFDRLIQLLITIAEYTPNETDLKTASLTTYLQSLQAANATAIDAETNLDNARIVRNEILYQPSTGLFDVASAVKLYVKSVFGATSAQYKQVSALKFTPL
jgi:hypothetical protein